MLWYTPTAISAIGLWMEQGDAAAVASISGGLRQRGSHFIVARTSTNAWSNELTRMSPRRGYSRSMMT